MVCALPLSYRFQYAGLVFLSLGWYTKELVYLFIVLYKAASLNQLADRLFKEVGASCWSSSSSKESEAQMLLSDDSHYKPDNSKISMVEDELRRFQVLAYLQAVPLSFTFINAFRPTYSSVAWNFASVCVTVFVSVLRVIIGF
jgi:hypothetical protein